MSSLVDLSFKNPLISKYFKGSNEYIPVSEMMYIHTHPLVTPNFLVEIDTLISRTSESLTLRNNKGPSFNRIVQLAQNLGKLLPVLDDNNAPEVLSILREIYKLCLSITEKG